jgi:hypothetical protein
MRRPSAPQLAYHVTAAANLPSILAAGLLPQIGERSLACAEAQPQIYLFPSIAALQDGLCNWLEAHFEEDQEILILAVDVAGLATSPAADFEIALAQAIPAARILLVLDEHLLPATRAPGPDCALNMEI